MSARAHACYCAHAILAAAIAIIAQLVHAENIRCIRDGLYADHDLDCREYVRCGGGKVTGRYACGAKRAFSEVVGACVPRRRHPCIRRECASEDTLAYATPGTACRHFYRCENGTVVDRACPSGSWFDLDLQGCARGAGTCYEPVCAGLPDGEYPDPSHECRRTLVCLGGELRAVKSRRAACAQPCPPPRSAAVPLPAGDADFCSDEACSSLCQHASDGAYADRSTGCREYFVCEARRVIRRGVCEPGLLFTNGGCELAAGAGSCPPPALSPCFNRADGLHRDWRDCASWFDCRRERVVTRGSCGPRFAFDGAGCVPSSEFLCEGPERAVECEGLPSDTYQDFESNCTRYFHCEGSLRTTFACPAGSVFDGVRCSPAGQYLCPSLERDSCYGRADGRYRAADTDCRGYYACVRGEKAVYACAAGRVFDGEACVPARPGLCLREDYSCEGLADGYHAEIESGCHRYFYCEGSDRLATLSCLGGKIFDGHACVEAAHHECGAPPRGTIENGGKRCERDGFYIQQGTECRRYYFCVIGTRTYLTCPTDQVFNGQVCVPRTQFTCPG